MTEAQKLNHSKHPIRKKILRIVMFTFLALLFLEFVVYFGSNLMLSSWARKKINEAAKDIYLVDFNRVRFSLFRRGLFMDGIVMKPIGERKPGQNQALFDLTLDELALRNLWFDFSEGILYVGKLEFDNPNISMDLPPIHSSDSSAVIQNNGSPVKALENELKKIIDKASIAGVYIDELVIDHADLFFLNFLSQNSLKAENTRLLVKDINWATKGQWTTPFNAKGFEFDLDNVDFPLPDGVHSIQSKNVYVSSLDNKIDIKDFRLNSNKSVDSKAYYDVFLSELRVGNVDLNEAFMTSNVIIDEIILNDPDFQVEKNASSEKDSTATGDLNELIQGILKSFEVQELSVNNGKFTAFSSTDTLKNRIEIEKLDFKMINFYLGEDESRKSDQFFYGEEAAMDIHNADLYLSDNVHVIYGDRVSVSSFKDEIIIENVRLEPRTDNLESGLANQIMRIALPKLTFSKANLKRLYNEGVFVIDEMLIQSPRVEITELNQKEKSQTGVPVRELLEGYLDEISIGRMDLRDGRVQFKNEEGVRSDDIGFESFSLLLENVLMQPNSSADVRNIFLADGMVLSLDKYRLKLRDNLHEFMADKVLIDSKNSLVVIDNFTLKPENPDSTQVILDAYGKSVILNISVPEFRLEGIDLMSAYMDEKLIIKRILIPSPVANYTRFRKKASSTSTSAQLDSSDEIESLLTSYFSSIQIDSVSFSNGQVHYDDYAGKKDISLSEDSLSLNLKGFYLEKGLAKSPDRTFYSNEIELILRKYDFSVAGGNYDVDTDGLRFNSLSKTIVIDNLTLQPSKSINSKIALSLNLPSVSLEGVDIESFLFENQLQLDKLAVNGSAIDLEINKNYQKEESKAKTGQAVVVTALPKSIELVSIQNIEATNSKLNINYRVGEGDFELIQTDFDIGIVGLSLDSAANAQKDIAGLFDEINLRLKDFSFTLPDSVHTIKFSNLYVNNTADETVFSNFQIVPSTTTGNPGSPIFAAKIDELGVRNNSIRDIQSSGIFYLNQLRLLNPTIDVYLDTVSKFPKSKKANEFSTSKEAGLIESILLQDVLFNNANIALHNKESGQIPRMMFNNVNFGLKDLDLDLLKNSKEVSPQLLLEKDLSLSLTNYHIYTNDSLNKLSIGKISYLDNTITLDSVSYKPTLGRYEYLRRKGYQDNAMDVYVSKVQLEGLDFDEYFNNEKLKASLVRFDGLDLDVFRDKRIPLKEGVYKPMPQYLMENSPFDVDIDSVIVTQGIVRYQEMAPKGMLPGAIYFADLKASIAPFVLRKSEEEFPLKSSKLHATSKLMGDGDITLKADMHFGAPYPMDVEVEIGEFDLTELNNFVTKDAFIKILDGRVTGGKWNFRINEDAARGKMKFRYEDLRIEFVDSLTLESGTGKLGFMTFLANLITKNSNPRKFFNRGVQSQIYLERDKSKFIFGSWWRATFSGLKGSVGLGQPKLPKRKEEEEE